MREETKNKIRSLHEVSWKGLWRMLIERRTFSKFPFLVSVIITATAIIFLAGKGKSDSYDLIKNTCELTLSFFPNLLGFTLGGFAIIVGFSNSDLIRQGTSIEEHSTYQILNAIFSYSILVQIVVTLLSFAISWCIKIDISTILSCESKLLCDCFNFFLLTIILFCSLFTLLITPLIIVNLFTFSQLNNSFYTISEADTLERELDEEQEASAENNTTN